MINDSTAWAMVYLGFEVGIIAGIVLMLLFDYIIGFVTFYRLYRFFERVKAAYGVVFETDRKIWLTAYRTREQTAKAATLAYIQKRRKQWR